MTDDEARAAKAEHDRLMREAHSQAMDKMHAERREQFDQTPTDAAPKPPEDETKA